MNNIYYVTTVAILHFDGQCPLHVARFCHTDSDEQSGNGRPLLYNIRSMTEDYIPTLKGSDLDRYMKKLYNAFVDGWANQAC